MHGPQPLPLKRLGAAFLALGVFWSLVVLYVVHAGLPHNPVRLPFAEQIRAQVWAPEGWAFFTRDAREERSFLFRREGARWVSASFGPQGRPANAMGLDRRARAQGLDFTRLMGEVPPEAWRPCAGEPAGCLAAAPVTGRVRNRAARKLVCGDVAIVRQRPVPWAWARSGRAPVMPSRVARLEVAC